MTLREATQQLTLDEFIQHYSQQPFELVNGEMRPLMPHVAVHQWIIRALFVLLYHYAVAKRLGEVLFELPTVELYNSTWVKGSRTPDILFFAAEKWDSYTDSTADWLKKPAQATCCHAIPASANKCIQSPNIS